MKEFDHEAKLRWQLEQLRGVTRVEFSPEPDSVFRVQVDVEQGELDAIWDDLVREVDEFEQGLAGKTGLDLEIRPS